jgi:hypothetical protein
MTLPSSGRQIGRPKLSASLDAESPFQTIFIVGQVFATNVSLWVSLKDIDNKNVFEIVGKDYYLKLNDTSKTCFTRKSVIIEYF